MIVLRTLVLFITSLNIQVDVNNHEGDLKAVIVLIRHGDRSPLSSWPNDPYFGDLSLWPDGYGALNNMGKQRQYQLGQWFRERYDGFLPARYNKRDIYVLSTKLDRTIMSAASNLAGLYPPSDDQVWNENIPWQAIPVHIIAEDSESMLTHHVSCPKHDRLFDALLNLTEFQEFNKEHAELFKNISDLTGYPLENIGIKSFSTMFSVLAIYKELNFTLPDWTEYYWQEIKTFAARYRQLATYTQDLARLRMGPLMNYLLEHLNLIKNQTSSNQIEVPKFLMLSAHGTTISDCTNAMGVYPNVIPQFASTVIWEVKSKNNGSYFVNMYFKNSTHFSSLTVPGCTFDCDVDSLVEVLRPIRVSVDQWTQECYEN